ncbi:MAG TPA: NAD(P)/FAD-dependent oxidoreductase [Kofleriaceae bacterium]|nr:NAD(P)/FAD-dependent oxidoreductase [Kofleriaceae bacterium]
MTRVGVIGCGTAGAAAAILLARLGCEVTVLERVPAPKPIGAGILLQPTGQAVMARMGLLEPIRARGSHIERLYLRSDGGRTLADLHYGAIDPTWFGIGLHRGLLFETLYNAARTEPGVTVRTGCTVRGLHWDRGVPTILDGDGNAYGPFDLVVVADGAVSELRGIAGTTTRDTAYPWGALWFVTDDPDQVFTRELYQIGVRAHRLYGVLPTGKGAVSSGNEQPVVSLFWSMAARDVDAWRKSDLEAWKAEVRALDPRISFVLDRITSEEQVTFARYRDVQMSRWCDRGVVFVGDAAHAASPQLGQGANLALVDAWTLADCVREQLERGHATGAAIEAALGDYARRRKQHLAYYQRMTRWLTPFFQSDSQLLGWVRDWVFPIANLIPPVRNHMIKTMAGVCTGFVGPRFALPASPDQGDR